MLSMFLLGFLELEARILVTLGTLLGAVIVQEAPEACTWYSLVEWSVTKPLVT